MFCLLQAGLAACSMFEEDWNAEIGDEALLPSLQKVLRLGGGTAMAMEYICFSISFLQPVFLQPEWLLGSGVSCSHDFWNYGRQLQEFIVTEERSFSLH